MNRFLSVMQVADALKIVRKMAIRVPTETVDLVDAFGRVLARDICSDVDIPGFDRSTVDGYAVRAADTTGAGESIPSMLTSIGSIPMGATPEITIRPGTCMYIPTGGFLPGGADAVVMIEYCEQMGDQILVNRPVAKGENSISRGEDFEAGKVSVQEGTRINSRTAGVLAACGFSKVPVAHIPRIGIISTGNELVPIDTLPSGGKIRDVNTYLCAGFVDEHGGLPVRFGIIEDEASALLNALRSAISSCDAILISGGSSKGERDMCADTIASLGKVLVHGIALSPGKPTIIGIAEETPIIGLPGHPASAYIVLLTIVRELLAAMTGADYKRSIFARLKSPVSSAQGREDYIRGSLNGEYITPVLGRSGLTNTLLHSDGVIRIPANIEGYEAGELVEVIQW